MRILCFGDSNTYGYDPRDFFGGRYPAQYRWTDILGKNHTVINAGENGRRIPVRAGEYILITSTPLDLMIIMLGANDLLQGLPPEDVAGRMEKFLMGLNVPKEKILLVAPPPLARGEWVPDQVLIDASRQLGNEYRALAERIGIRCAGPWQIPLAYDGVHFTEIGHMEFARRMTVLIDGHTYTPI